MREGSVHLHIRALPQVNNCKGGRTPLLGLTIWQVRQYATDALDFVQRAMGHLTSGLSAAFAYANPRPSFCTFIFGTLPTRVS